MIFEAADVWTSMAYLLPWVLNNWQRCGGSTNGDAMEEAATRLLEMGQHGPHNRIGLDGCLSAPPYTIAASGVVVA
jgi:hypothetical protein